MNLYCSTTELKTFLGITGSTEDALLAMLNKQATQVVNSIISVSDLSLHKVSAERHDGQGQILYLKDMQVAHIGTVTEDVDGTPSEYTQTPSYDIQNNVVRFDSYLSGGYRQLTIDYAAGWNVRQFGYIDIVDYTGLALDTVTIGSLAKVEGTGWTAGTSNAATATSLAAAFNGGTVATGKTIEAFAVGSRVYFINSTVADETEVTITLSDSTNMTKSGASLGGINFPEDIKGAIMTLVSSLRAKRKNPTMKSYTIGSKSVSFGTKEEFESFRDMLSAYKRVSIVSV